MKNLSHLVAALCATLLLAACGGGGGSSAVTGTPTNPGTGGGGNTVTTGTGGGTGAGTVPLATDATVGITTQANVPLAAVVSSNGIIGVVGVESDGRTITTDITPQDSYLAAGRAAYATVTAAEVTIVATITATVVNDRGASTTTTSTITNTFTPIATISAPRLRASMQVGYTDDAGVAMFLGDSAALVKAMSRDASDLAFTRTPNAFITGTLASPSVSAVYTIPAHGAIGQDNSPGRDAAIMSNEQPGTFATDFNTGTLNLMLNAYGGRNALQGGGRMRITDYVFAMTTQIGFISPFPGLPAILPVTSYLFSSNHCPLAGGSATSNCGGNVFYGGVNLSAGSRINGASFRSSAVLHGADADGLVGGFQFVYTPLAATVMVNFLGASFGVPSVPIVSARSDADKLTLANATYVGTPLRGASVSILTDSSGALLSIITEQYTMTVSEKFITGRNDGAFAEPRVEFDGITSSVALRFRVDTNGLQLRGFRTTSEGPGKDAGAYYIDISPDDVTTVLELPVTGTVSLAATIIQPYQATASVVYATITQTLTTQFTLEAHMHAPSSVNFTHIMRAEYAAFAYHYVANTISEAGFGLNKRVSESDDFFWGSRTPREVMNHLSAIGFSGTYTIPKNGAQGIFYDTGTPDNSRFLTNAKNSGTFRVHFGSSRAVLDLNVDAYERGGDLTENFMQIRGLQAQVIGSGFSNDKCPAHFTRGTGSHCGGSVDFVSTNPSAAPLDMANTTTGTPTDYLRIKGMFAGPSGEEVVGSVERYKADSINRVMKLQFIGAGAGGVGQ